ncbi:single-stranded DNA-binding protein, partial [Francisella tularensis subsp. holarctica]|nr:single-stranded DNA-binding protein [Francisella tularensis subsp. holarctica]
RTNKWKYKNCNMLYTTEVVASNFQFMGGGYQGGANNQNTPNFNQQPNKNFNQNHQQQSIQDKMTDFAENNSSNFDDDI